MEKGCTNKPHVVLVIFHDFPLLGCFTLFHHPFFHLPGLHPGPSLALLGAPPGSQEQLTLNVLLSEPGAFQGGGTAFWPQIDGSSPTEAPRCGSDAVMPRFFGGFVDILKPPKSL